MTKTPARIVAVAALLLGVLAMADTAQAHQQATAGPASTSDYTYDVCTFTNPNPSGYAVTQWSLRIFYPYPPIYNSNGANVHQHIQVYCRWVPFKSPNYGPLCRVIQRHNNPATLPPGDDWDWHVLIDYYSCPNP
jgi:hypothetical protein